jgi:hypothetical protein
MAAAHQRRSRPRRIRRGHRLAYPTAVLLLGLIAACGQSGESTVSVATITFGFLPPTPTPTPSPPPAASAAPTPALAPDVIGLADARALVDAWNAARSRAQANLDAAPLAAVESAPALDADRVELQLERSGAARRAAAPTVDGVVVAVPHQSGYPAVVYATQRVTRGSSTTSEVLGFTRASAASAWALAWHATAPDAKTVLPAVQVGADGFSANLDPSGQHALVADVPTLANRLAASFRPGAAADATLILDQGMPDIAAAARATISSFARTGDSAAVDFSGAPTPLAVQTSDGGAACVVVVTYTAALSAAAGRSLAETAAQHPYGQGLLAPGNYAQIVDHYVFVFGASVPGTTSGSTIFVFAIGGGLVSATGTPAPVAPSP